MRKIIKMPIISLFFYIKTKTVFVRVSAAQRKKYRELFKNPVPLYFSIHSRILGNTRSDLRLKLKLLSVRELSKKLVIQNGIPHMRNAMWNLSFFSFFKLCRFLPPLRFAGMTEE